MCRHVEGRDCRIVTSAMPGSDTGREREFRSVTRQPVEVRYAHFVKRATDQGRIWSLWGNGWVLASDDDGNELHPVWPDAMYAAAVAIDEWSTAKPRAITVRDWLDAWTPGMLDAGRKVVVFPTSDDGGARIDPDVLAADLREELALME
jgi:hypothetical protein